MLADNCYKAMVWRGSYYGGGGIVMVGVESGVPKLLGTGQLPADDYRAAPAFAGKKMYVHGRANLICLGE